jgi:hypothetical protein
MLVFGWFRDFRFAGFVAIVLVLMTTTSCLKKEEFPIVPQIKYEGFDLEFDSGMYAKRGYLTISFKDGDGDIGLFPEQKQPPFDTGSIYYYNYHIDYYERRMGTFVKIDLDPSFNARIPYLTPSDPNKAIKGIIVDTLQLNPAPVYDTIKFKFCIYDRALHRSNYDSTPPIVVRRR